MVALAQGDDLAQHLGVEAGALGLGIDVLDVAADAGLLLLEAFDALDEGLELVGRDRIGRTWSLRWSMWMPLWSPSPAAV